MQVYPKKEAIRRMNSLAKADVPFLFVIDYMQEHSYIETLDQIDPTTCLYRFREAGNVEKSTADDAGEAEKAEWEIIPPTPGIYKRAFDIVKQNLLAGNSYLTNLTCKIPVTTNLTLKDIFLHSKALYKLWLKDKLVCFSPEIFVRIENGKIKSFPMKGTIDATLPDAENILMKDEKEAAEHATIVDLIRNDLSMVANQVEVSSYRYIDYLQTNKGPILQTSSEICGVLSDDYPEYIGDILFKLLPAGSITGAPKSKTMQIIADAENYERGFYTGIMGCYADKELDSAVMIRFIEQEDGQLYFKAGGGITAKSRWESEYNEVIQKVYVPIY
ncbi:aminodeoxychorismate synthase component I [Bacteroides helcogenes]|uniref:Chorismate binding protein n=1 Tax=Bacteroides helcogenes (strain ATCC 35417 / DSM 20613 / JCM 6297 / CCUG 15421 / P 36-108) TaxID=693979 RepID=E6STG5_BACT6|nr:aminodeoxychorismate synthase component I [Bacteroides helcogenes]ADV43239.1 Chorismate binding protein [Bacteroides helcogenes P 36-108]MDY5238579.1 aminodeoxychorismate synthase component I [Bacteroides helcogenes]